MRPSLVWLGTVKMRYLLLHIESIMTKEEVLFQSNLCGEAW